MEKFLRHGSVQKVLHRGSIEDCAYPLFGIEQHNDSNVVKKWRISYIVEA